MKKTFAIVILAFALNSCCFAQGSGGDRSRGAQVLIITNGPVVENVTDTTAQIAWSTNVSSSTIVHYGVDPINLNGVATMPWGALTHRVQLKNLKPSTMYYFRAESGQGQGTGTDVQAAESAFQTKPAPSQSESNHENISKP
jgi:predicted small secreted protein